MKKFLCSILLTLLTVVMAFGVVACTPKQKTDVNVYAPDGAPALALAQLMHQENNLANTFATGYHVVKAETIQGYVTGDDPMADVAILPVNLAVKLLGNGQTYQMLGTVTHGNLYLLSKTESTTITTQNISSLQGKKVGVINLPNVPGLTLKVILSQNNIPYTTIEANDQPQSDKVNLVALSGAPQIASTNLDFYVVPEPAASLQVSKQGLSFVGDLQALYGGSDGYVQAVAVAKKTLIQSHGSYVKKFIQSLNANTTWLAQQDTTAQMVVEAVNAHLPQDTTPTLSVANLTKQVIANCGIRFVSAHDSKQKLLDFMQKLNAVSATSWGIPDETFFYQA